jgi:hypothetical protein
MSPGLLLGIAVAELMRRRSLRWTWILSAFEIVIIGTALGAYGGLLLPWLLHPPSRGRRARRRA